MGLSWSPDPSSGDRGSKEEGLSAISGVPSVFAIDSDDDDDRDETAGARLRANANDGYELLGDNDYAHSTRDDDDWEHDSDENVSFFNQLLECN